MKNYRVFFIFFLLFLTLAIAQTPAKYKLRVSQVLLDDQPSCLQLTERLGLIGNAEVISPHELLGRYTTSS